LTPNAEARTAGSRLMRPRSGPGTRETLD